ncbi:hypothetical protein TWF696_005177 [Orbilia brochopaga]|uniref:SAM-dependent MTase RsmB/NOP-type domain-containing protein n=1 Tax=Orbilia brochopaga TaxID=3140254 RepID=A0AAV9V6I6_9PEZI
MSLYLEAAAILQLPQTTSLKSIIYNPAKPFKSPQPKLYALIVETLKFQDILKEVVENAGILELERKLTPLLSILLTHDLLLAKSGIAASNGPLKDAITRHKARLTAEFTRARIRRGHADVKALVEAVNAEHGRESEDGVAVTSTGLTTFNPRWIRVNTLKSSLDEVLRSPTFREFDEASGMTDLFFFNTVQKHYHRRARLLPDIFAIHPSHDVVSSELYKTGAIILQSAASCLPAIMLNPPVGATVVDGCAAPGNKTTHLAALVGSTGRVFAVERDRRRAEVLEKMTAKAGAEGIVRVLKATDFTTIGEGHEAWEAARYLLLDPSCSGSGILQRIDWDISKLSLPCVPERGSRSTSSSSRKRKRGGLDEGNNAASSSGQQQQPVDAEVLEHDATKEGRLQSLADFQLAIVLHAFSFPNATRITYSTCSIHAEENEGVVVRALSSEIARARGWTVQSREENPLADWYRRGMLQEFSSLDADDEERARVAEGCVRVNRTDSLGGGFFVVCFVRKAASEELRLAGSTCAEAVGTDCAGAGEHSLEEAFSGELQDDEDEEEEWHGISDDADTNQAAVAVAAAADGSTALRRRRKPKRGAQDNMAANAAVNTAINRRFQKKRGKGWS